MSIPQQEQALRDALTALETALDTPIISGELKDWVESVRKTLDAAAAALLAQFHQGHRQQFANILQQDLEMARQVEQLKEEDQAILQQMTELGRELDGLAAVAGAVGRHESQAQAYESQVVQAGLMFIARVRKQETAITTWLMEAFQRDRGTGD
jgi:hypothetical protein